MLSQYAPIPRSFDHWFLSCEPDEELLCWVQDHCNPSEVNEAIVEMLDRWDEISTGWSARTANWFIWAIFSYPFFLSEEDLDNEQKLRLIDAAEKITLSFPRIQPDEAIETGFFMLWDLIGNMGDVLIPALERLVFSSDDGVCFAALHGLGHLGEDRVPIILRLLEVRADLKNDSYVRRCLDGTVL